MNVNYLTLQSFKVGYTPDSIMLIEHCYGNHFATITRDAGNKVYVNRYDGKNFEDAMRYDNNSGYVYRDITYNPSSDYVDVLFRNNNYTTPNSFVCNVYKSGTNPNVMYATYYYAYDADLYSLDYLSTRPQWDIVSGKISGPLALVRHRNSMWQCNTHSYFGWRKKTYNMEEYVISNSIGKGFELNASVIECGQGSTPIIDNCVSTK